MTDLTGKDLIICNTFLKAKVRITFCDNTDISVITSDIFNGSLSVEQNEAKGYMHELTLTSKSLSRALQKRPNVVFYVDK